MTNKDVAIEVIRKLPEEATFEEISEQVAILAAIRRGEEAAAAGQVTSHEDVKKKLASWTSR